MQYWMEKSDFALLPDPVVVYYSVGGEMQSTSTAKTSVPTDSDGNACVFSRAITNQTLDWVSLYPAGRCGLTRKNWLYASGMP